MVDEVRGEELHNSWAVEADEEELRMRVGDSSGLDYAVTVQARSREVREYHERLVAAAREASRRRRAQLAKRPVPKPRSKTKPRSKPRHACPVCDETGKVWVGDVEEVCDRCEGRGWIR